ncbi:hypothetical protein PENTCL1PPCAC_24224 [Pristionchus entomophagus]|uniref:Uncharacterized protein n=1 Tax=Pristionchus entomophagus TaxID=358040 RepID=A0AAV5U6M6_9BILA|nr:hypothetical protein PENTCL1PPCAC_24224 [Pristionchus entomophagus]
MKDAARNKAIRPCKRDVILIDDDESANDRPAVKSIKPDPSSEIVKLQEEVDKWKGKFERACREALKDQLRAEAAEARVGEVILS